VIVRREVPADVLATRVVVAAAFTPPGRPGELPEEVTLLDELRADPGWLPELSLVALGPDGEIAGHVVCSRGHVESAPVLALGPLGVHPTRQRRGIGQALVHAVLGAADALGEPMVVLLGSPLYYSRFGFRLAAGYGVEPAVPGWAPHFQVRTLTTYSPDLRGRFAYPPPFDRV
jgi:putative acetyltransferase